MTLRAVIPAHDEPQVRRSARVKTVAALLDDDPSQIRRMLAEGKLEGHRVGKRGVRIYLDSVAEWQRRNPLGKAAAAQETPKKPRPATMHPATRAAHRQAVALLESMGLMPTSRR